MKPQKEDRREPKPCSHACTQTHKSQPITTLKHQTPKPPDCSYNTGGYGLFRSFPLLSAPTRGDAASPSKTCPCAACSSLFAKTSISRHSHQHQYVLTHLGHMVDQSVEPKWALNDEVELQTQKAGNIPYTWDRCSRPYSQSYTSDPTEENLQKTPLSCSLFELLSSSSDSVGFRHRRPTH